MIFLENADIKVSVSTKGAELQSLINKHTSKEYMWAGDPEFWGKYSPVLFPIVGALKNNSYLMEGHKYQLSRHGFARDNKFEHTRLSESHSVFILKDNELTANIYPFKFSLEIHYQLVKNTLRCLYVVQNPSEKPLLFSIGAHPAFATSTEDGLIYNDYYLEFNKDPELVYQNVMNDLIGNSTSVLPLENNRLMLTHELFHNDALVFKNLKSDRISLKNTKTSNGLHFHFSNFPFFGIWAAKNANFVCLEPWCGIADGVNHNQEFIQKEGIITLAPSAVWTRHWEIETF